MIRVEIRNNATGEVRDCTNRFSHYLDIPVPRKLTEAPFSLFCDCDRSYHFSDGDTEGDKCGHTRFSVRLTTADGQRIYSDFAEDDKMKHFNGLTPAEDERLALLLEECGEVLQCVGKIQRHGYESCDPLETLHPVTNRQALERELGDLMAAVYLLRRNFDVRPVEIEKARVSKMAKLSKWLHHNKISREDME